MTMKTVALLLLAAVLSVAATTMVTIAGPNQRAGIAYAQNEGDGDNNQGGTNEPDGANNQCDDGFDPLGLPCL